MLPLLLLLPFALCNLSQQIATLNTLLSTEGPSSDTLGRFEAVISEVEKTNDHHQLSGLYLKKALIQLNLNRENGAIESLERVLSLDPGNRVAKDKLVDLLLDKGHFAQLVSHLSPDNKEDNELLGDIDTWNISLQNAEQFYESHDYLQCLGEINKNLDLTPYHARSVELHYLCSAEVFKKDPYATFENDAAVNLVVMEDLSKLIKIQPMVVSRYAEFAKMVLFTEGRFESAWNTVKLCLKIDNEYKECGDMSKFLSKMKGFFTTFQLAGQHYNVLASETEEQSFEEPNLFADTVDFLFNEPVKASQAELRKIKAKNNYEYLLHKATQFSDNKNLKFVQTINKLACEGLVRAKSKDAKAYCSKVNGSFFPRDVLKVDKLLKNNKFAEARELMTKYPVNMQKTSLFRERYAKIEQWEHQNRQRQQQHQRQQYQWQRQQHHQQPQQQTRADIDFYKVLDIPRDADERTIKKAYRAQTLKYHPDKYKGKDLTPEQIEQKMQEINEAYEVLSSKESREQYDRGNGGGNRNGGNQFNFQQQPFHFDFGNFGGGGFKFNF